MQGTVKRSIPLHLKTWYRVDISLRPSESGKVIHNMIRKIKTDLCSTDNNSSIQIMVTVTVNGVTMSSKEIQEVRGTGHLYTGPQLGYPPAVGVIRDVTILNSDAGE